MGELREVALPGVAARYFPPSSGKYEVKPGLIPLGTDFGNGPADKLTFQFDAGFADYRKVKRAARAELLGKYYQARDFAPEIAGTVCRFIVRRLAEEHPGLFVLDERSGEVTLRCALTGETLRFDPAMRRVAGTEADRGPKGGVIVGKREYIERIQKNPITRAVRIDKLTLAGFEATLMEYIDEERAIENIPTLRMLLQKPEEIRGRANRIA